MRLGLVLGVDAEQLGLLVLGGVAPAEQSGLVLGVAEQPEEQGQQRMDSKLIVLKKGRVEMK